MIDTHKLAIDLADRLDPDDGTTLTFSQKVRMIEDAIEDAYKAGKRQAEEDQ